jgi:hypothetical protein
MRTSPAKHASLKDFVYNPVLYFFAVVLNDGGFILGEWSVGCHFREKAFTGAAEVLDPLADWLHSDRPFPQFQCQ